MKILVVSQHFWPENFRVNDLVLGLKERGHDVTVLTGLPNYPVGDIFSDYLENKDKYSIFEGIDVVRLPVIPRKKGKSVNLVLNFLSFLFAGLFMSQWKLRGKNFDKIFVFGNSPLTAAIPAILLGKIKKAPICLWVMDLWPDTLITMGVVKKGIQERLAKSFVSFIYNHCELILGQSHSFVSSIKELTKTKVGYFPSWSDVTDNKSELIFDHGDKFNISFAGNMGEAQDFPSIIKAAEFLKNENSNVRFVIVGDGRVTAEVKELIVQKELSGQMILLGRHPVDKMGSLFKQSDALLVTLKSDPVFAKTIPGKVQTYLAAGKPILSMMDGEVQNVVNFSNSGIAVDAGDFEGLAKAAIKLSQSSQYELQSYSDSAKIYYEKEFERNLLLDKLANYLVLL